MEKLISFCVPCYNYQEFMHKCIDSLLKADLSKIEIIIVDDGSTDNTGKIANGYHDKYPEIIHVIHKENGGHGSGVNVGIREAKGLYYKVVDSDDWVDEASLHTLLSTIEDNLNKNIHPDVYFVNFVFENANDGSSYVDEARKYFPANKLFTFEETHKYKVGEFPMMHSIICSLDIIKESKIELPEKTFYVDNLFIYGVMGFVKTLYYLDIDFYRYLVGTGNQSVSKANMSKRYDQQLRVITLMSNYFTLEQLKALPKKHYLYMKHFFVTISFLTMYFVYGHYTKEKNRAYKSYLKRFKKSNPSLYHKFRWGTLAGLALFLFRGQLDRFQ